MPANFATYSLTSMLLSNERKKANQIYLRQPRNGEWYEYTWKDVMQEARQVAHFLLKNGLQRGDRVSILSKNCAEWFITDFGITLAGMVNVPLFPNQNKESVHYVLDHAEVKLVFVGKLDNHDQVRSNIPPAYKTVSFDYHADMQVDFHWEDVLKNPPLDTVAEMQPDELYTIIYTSGTSAMPKGAMYTHQTIANYLALLPGDIRRLQDLEHYKLISYLPLAHVYERTAIELGSITLPCSVSFVESLDLFADNLRDVGPTFFTAVPRIWGVFQQKIEQKVSPSRLNLLLKIPLISGYVKRKIIFEMGLEQCKNFICGAAHLPIPTMEFFDKLGIKIQEGYGQSENLAYATLTMLDDRRYGYVGTPRNGVEIKMGPDDELLVKSECLMSGYYKNLEKTKESFTEDGWLRTGDVVQIDAHQRVKILGRLSENFKNQKGEFITPTPIEKKFKMNGYIEQLCLIGKELPTNILLITLSNKGRLESKEKLGQLLHKSLHDLNKKLANYEKISHILVLKDDWTPENDLLTPTLKVKRRSVEEKYHDLILKSGEDHQPVVWQ